MNRVSNVDTETLSMGIVVWEYSIECRHRGVEYGDCSMGIQYQV